MPEVTDEDGRLVRVVAPSRLHFGLLSFGHRAGRRYGGIGLMIDRPAVRLSLSGAARLTIGFEMPHESSTRLEAEEIRRSLTVRVEEFASNSYQSVV